MAPARTRAFPSVPFLAFCGCDPASAQFVGAIDATEASARVSERLGLGGSPYVGPQPGCTCWAAGSHPGRSMTWKLAPLLFFAALLAAFVGAAARA
jgi:hypothetical protein